MLNCHACMKRCLRTLIGDSALVSTSRRRTFPNSRPRQSYRRNYSSLQQTHINPARESTATWDRKSGADSPAHKLDSGFKKGTDTTSYNRQKWLESRGVTPMHKRAERKTDAPLIKKHLTYLKDPLKLAEHVRKTLREDDFESALAIVRAASKDTQCVVSWNHLIDWQLSKEKMNGAIKTYNEMKKRAQTPDAYTYTIIFRGCAEHPLPAQALSKVITIYYSMLADKSPIKPNTIHMNAVLRMCAKANDMDALYSMATQLPAKGVRAPNNLTYTIILNAIRMHAFDSLRGSLTPVQQRRNRQKANLDARLLWEDVTKRWLQGDIMIDEALVCGMGRIMLLGVENDIDDVMSLIQQTMNIPRQAPSLGSPELPKKDPRHQGNVQAMSDKLAEAEQSKSSRQESVKVSLPSPSLAVITNENLSFTVTDPFRTPNITKKATNFYAKPGKNTISLLMSAFLDMRLKEPATKYWNILTSEHNVQPDAENYHGYLRVLRVARASTETVSLLLTMPKDYMEAKTFRIAMSTCMRDKNNIHAFSNAGKVLDLMQTAITVPDIQTLYNYLDVAFSTGPLNLRKSLNGKNEPTKTEQGKQIMRALERINPSYVNLRSLMAYGDPTNPGTTVAEKAALTTSVLDLTQKMVSAHDHLLNKALVDRTLYSDLTKERSKLAAFITRFKERRFSRPTLPSPPSTA